MDQTHLHLIANHLPVVGSILGAFVLAYGIFVKSAQTQNAAYIIFLFCAIGAAVTYVTGEAVEDKIEQIAGVSEAMIEAHEESATAALAGMLALGFVSMVALFFSFKGAAVNKPLSYVVLLIALVSFGLIAYTANQGGKIRHTELSPQEATVPYQAQPAGSAENEDDDD